MMCCNESTIFYFNPRSPQGERPKAAWGADERGAISIHAPRRGSDPDASRPTPLPLHFNPRSPQGERPSPFQICQHQWHFNPRSPQGERLCVPKEQQPENHFNPRSPQGERPRPPPGSALRQAFQSTLPAGGATRLIRIRLCGLAISIHAPRRGSDHQAESRNAFFRGFQSTLPAGGATQSASALQCRP